MTRPGWTGHSRFDDVGRDRAPGLTDEDLAEEEPIVHWRRLADSYRTQLDQMTRPDSPRSPDVLARVRRDLAACERAIAHLELDDHWTSGAGDRRLF